MSTNKEIKFHKPDFGGRMSFFGTAGRETTRTNCKNCGKRIHWKGGHDAFFFGGTYECSKQIHWKSGHKHIPQCRKDAPKYWNTKSDWWRKGKQIETKGCIS